MCVLAGMLCVACLYDYKSRKIPNPLILLIMGIGIIRGYCLENRYGLGKYAIVFAVVVFLLYPLFRIGGLGAGDVKLMSVCAGFFPAEEAFYFLFISLLFSAIFSIFKLIRKRDLRDRIRYFCNYCRNVAGKGRWYYYQPKTGDRKLEGICMSGPVLCSVLLKIGGVY